MKDKNIEDIASKMNEFFQNKEYNNKREEYNIKISNLIRKFLIEKPYLRFCQAIIILNLDKSFYEEPWITYERLEETIKNLK